MLSIWRCDIIMAFSVPGKHFRMLVGVLPLPNLLELLHRRLTKLKPHRGINKWYSTGFVKSKPSWGLL